MNEGQATRQTYSGLRRETPLPSCILKRADLRTLFARLQEKGRSGLEFQIGGLDSPEGTNPDEWERLKDQARNAANLTAIVLGSGGEQLLTTEEDGLLDRNLPDRIISVMFDSAMGLKNSLNVDAQNRFLLKIDFSAPPNFNEYDPLSQPTPNGSSLEITGPDETWVSGVHELVVQFFRSRVTPRRLVHSGTAFFLLHWFLVVPASIWTSYRVVGHLPLGLTTAHPALTTGLYCYFFLLAFLAFRVLKLAGRRVWPYVELEGETRRVGRFFFTTISVGFCVALVYDLAKHFLL